MNENAVELCDVTKSFGDHVAVDDLSLTVPRDGVLGFIGPNGSGKTTTMRMIVSVLHPDRGDIRLFGKDRRDAGTDRIGYLPEERGLYRKMKVRDLLLFYGALKGARDLKGEVDRWLEQLGLGDWSGRKVEALSKGMSQKVQFIATVVSRPELVVLDEPFAGLDPLNAEVIREAVLALREAGTTVILSTHDMAVAESLSDSILMIFKGRKVLDGTLASIQDRYGSDRIRVRLEEGAPPLPDLPGVDRVRDLGQTLELSLGDDGDAQEVLAAIVARTRVRRFELAQPSLNDIFVRIARPEPEEVTDA